MNNLTIRAKLIISFIAVAIIAGIVGIIGYIGITQVMKSHDEVAEVRLPSINALLTISEAQTAAWSGERGLINRRMMEPEIRRAQYKYIEEAMERAEKAWSIYEPLPQSKEEASEWKKFVDLWNSWKEENERVVELSKDKDKLIAAGSSLNDSNVTAIDNITFTASLDAREDFLKAEKSLLKLVQIIIMKLQKKKVSLQTPH